MNIRRSAPNLLNISFAAVLMFCIAITFANAAQPALMQIPTEAVGKPDAVNATAAPAPRSPLHVTFALTASSQQDIDQYISSLTDPKSPQYHHWITPQEFGQKFGASQQDVSAVVGYLAKKGMTGITVWPDQLFVSANTTKQDAETAFNVTINGYNRTPKDVARGLSATYYAPDRQPTVDASVAPKISAIFGLSNAVEALPSSSLTGKAVSNPDASSSGYFEPTDLANAYNTVSLHNNGLNGAGETIAIYSPTAFTQSDITRFETAFGITSPNVNIVNVMGITGATGNTSLTDQAEACIDIETVLGQAPAATVNVYESPNDGGFEIFEQVEKDDPNILTMSYGIDEDEISQAYVNAYETLRQALVAEGITLFIASGDNGAFDSTNQTVVTVSVDASSGYVTAVGGTELSALSNNTWNGEVAWTYKDGTISGNAGSGGGISKYITQPSWQTGGGVNTTYSDGMRQVPDVSALGSKPYYYISTEGGWYAFGGTSCSTPLWASSVALIEESLGSRLGNINPQLYSFAASSSSPFHDITSGNDGLYYCGTGWDFVTGWGSADFGKLLTSFSAGTEAPFSLSSSPTSLTVTEGQSGSTTVSLTNGSASPSAALTVSGAPTGVTTSLSASPITSSTTSSLTFNVSPTTAAGTYQITVTGTATQGTETTVVSLTVSSAQIPTSLTVSPSSASVVLGNTQTFTAVVNNQFGTALSPQPTVTWSTSGGGTISSSGVFTATTVGGPYTVTATDGGISGTASVTVTAPPSYSLSSNPSSLTVKQGTSGQTVVSVTPANGFAGTVSFSESTLPSGVTVGTSTTGNATTLTFSATPTAATGTSTITITGTSGSLTQTTSIQLTIASNPILTSISVSPTSPSILNGATEDFTATAYDQFGDALSPQPTFTWSVSGGGTISSSGVFTATTVGGPYTVTATDGGFSGTASVTVTAPPSYSLSSNPSSLTVKQGTSGQSVVTVTPANGFAGTVSFSESTLPSGVTVGTSTTGNATTLTFSATPTAATGTSTITITGTSGSLTQTTSIQLTIASNPILTSISVSPTSASILNGATEDFTATAYDQFGDALSPQPTFTWSVSGGGTISSSGVFTATTVGGPYTVTATDGGISGTASVTVTAPPSFSLSSSPSSLTVKQGTSGQSVVSVTPANGFAGTVSFSESTLPSGVTVGTSTTGNATTLTFSATPTATTGTYTITVTGTSGSLTQTTSIQLTIASNPILTSISVSPTSASILNGATEDFTATAFDQFGDALSPQPTFTWSASGGGTISSSGVFTATTVGGPYTVTATDGGISGTASVTVTAPPSFSLSSSPSSLTVKQGTSGQSVVSVTPANGFAGTVSFSESTLPSGVTVGTSTTGNATALTFSATPTATTGTSTITITGTSGSLTQTTPIHLTVAANQILTSIGVTPTTASIMNGATEDFIATAYSQTGAVMSPQPVFTWSTTGGGTVNPAGVFAASSAGGPYTVTAANNGIKATGSITVVALPTFSITASPTLLNIKQGMSGQSVVTVDPANGFNGSVTFSEMGVPSGVTVGVLKTSSSANLTFSVGTSAATGSYVVTVTAASGSIVKTTTILLTIEANQVLASVRVTPVSASILTGSSEAFVATAYSQTGAAMSPQPQFTWTVSGGGVISSSGVFIATTVGGPYTVKATSGLVSSDALITVTAPTSFSITATPASLNINEGSTGRTSILLKPVNGFNSTATLTILGVPSGITYSLSSSMVSSSTLPSITFTASATTLAGTYPVQVLGTSGQLRETTTIDLTIVKYQIAKSVVLSPASATVITNGSQTFTAKAYDQFGLPLVTQPSFSWSVVSGGIGAISSNGVYKSAATTGNASVKASFGSISGSAVVVVTVPSAADR